jgi:hypothetical protein
MNTHTGTYSDSYKLVTDTMGTHIGTYSDCYKLVTVTMGTRTGTYSDRYKLVMDTIATHCYITLYCYNPVTEKFKVLRHECI